MEVPVELVESAKAGDERAIEELIRRSQTSVYTLAYRLTGNEEDARDVTQETFIRVVRNLKKFRGDSSFSTWLFRVTSNSAYTLMAKRKRRAAESLDELTETFEPPADTAPGPEARAISSDARDRLVTALSKLSENDRIVVVMKDIYGFPHEEIAAELGIGVSACKVRLFRARQRLRDVLEGDGASEKEQVS